MPEEDKEWFSFFKKKRWPYTTAAVLVSPVILPSVLDFATKAELILLWSAGLLIGLLVAYHLAGKSLFIRTKRKGVIAVGLLAATLFVLTVRYFRIRPNAENHFYEVVAEVFALGISVGILMFLVGPTLRLASYWIRGK